MQRRKIKITWEGSFQEEHSLAMVNRQIIARLSKMPEFHCNKATTDSLSMKEIFTNHHALDRVSDHEGILISHQWPPRMEAPGRKSTWISIIPWEFGSVPVQWYLPMKYEMDEIWVYSQYNKDCYIRSGLPEHKIRVIPLGVDESIFHPNVQPDFFEQEDDRFRFIYVGGTIARKGFDLLLEAYLAEFSQDDSVCLVVKDHGINAHYKGITMEKRIRKAQLDPRSPSIEYIDAHLTSEQLASLYTSCHCAVFPYRGEGFGLPIAESAACGLPVIVPRLGPATEILGQNHAIYIDASEYVHDDRKVGEMETIDFPWWIDSDLNDLRKKMRFAFENQKEIREIGRRASEHIHSTFTWNKSAECVAQALEHVNSSQRPDTLLPKQIIKTETECVAKDLAEHKTTSALGKLLALHHAYPDEITVTINAAQLYMKQNMHLSAIGLLAPLAEKLKTDEDVPHSLQAHLWTLLAISYCKIQSWTLAVDAFRQASDKGAEIDELKVEYLRSAVQSLQLVLGNIHQELGDAYLKLNHVSAAEAMYHHAQSYHADHSSIASRLQQIQETKHVLSQKIKPFLKRSQQLISSSSGEKIQWNALDQKNVYPIEFILQKDLWASFFLAGQNVLILTIDDAFHMDQLQSNSWDGMMIFIHRSLTSDQMTSLFKWCSAAVNPGATIIIHSKDCNSETYQAFTSLFQYRNKWNKKGAGRDGNSSEYTIFQYSGFSILWRSPYYNASGYATEQNHFLESLQPYPLVVKLDALDAAPPVDSRQQQNKTIYLTNTKLNEEPLIHYQAAPAHIFTTPKAPLSVGRTMFETDRLPRSWVNKLNECTEVWVPSHFNMETFSNYGVPLNKIRVVPGMIDESKYDPAKVSPYGLPNARRFKFLSVFDWSIRKGWDILLRAYFESFTAEDDVSLVLKISKINEPAAQVRQIVNEMRKAHGYKQSPHIMMIEDRLSEEEMIQLYAACDAFVLPTRGEGWGRPFMEAMALEVPVIGTKWSGHLEFMNDTNSYLIEVEKMVPVPESMPPHFHGHQWAEPSLEHLKSLMKEVYAQQQQAKERAKIARKSLFPRFSMNEVGKLIYTRFDHLLRDYLG